MTCTIASIGKASMQEQPALPLCPSAFCATEALTRTVMQVAFAYEHRSYLRLRVYSTPSHDSSPGLSHTHRCLVVRNERIISNSVARLRPHHAAALLECAVERLRARARRGPELTVWIRAVLTHHTAYLMAAPGVLPILATLSQVTFESTAQKQDW